jgi:hypothetical protein
MLQEKDHVKDGGALLDVGCVVVLSGPRDKQAWVNRAI